MYLLIQEFETPNHIQTFRRTFTLPAWRSWHFLTWYAVCWGWRREAKMDQKCLLLLQNSLRQVVPPSLSSALFSVFYRCLCQTYPWTGWELTEYDFFFSMEAYIWNYNLCWNLTPPWSCCCCCYLSYISPIMFWTKENDLILYRDVASVNRYTTTPGKKHVGKYCLTHDRFVSTWEFLLTGTRKSRETRKKLRG